MEYVPMTEMIAGALSDHLVRCRPFIERFLAAGFVLIEVHARGERLPSDKSATGKEPVAKAWEKTTKSPTVERVMSWLARGRNYGLLPGASGLAVLDVEPAGMELWPLEKVPRGVLIVRSPSGGFHVYLDLGATERALGRTFGKLKLQDKAELFGRTGQVLGPGCFAWSNKGGREGVYEVVRDGAPLADENTLRWLLARFIDKSTPKMGGGHKSGHRAEGAHGAGSTRYGQRALELAISKIRAAPNGTRQDTFLSEGTAMFSLVASGELDQAEVECQLANAYRAVLGDEIGEFERRMCWARDKGLASPRCTRGPRLLGAPRSALGTGDSEGLDNQDDSAQEQVVRLEDGERDTVGGIVDRIELALAEDLGGADPVYQRGGALVHLTTPRRGGKVRRDPRSTVISLCPVPFLARRAGRCLSFLALKGRGDARDWTRTDLPTHYAEFLASLGSWPNIPVLEGVIFAPTLRTDGSLLARPGYDKESGLLVDFQGVRFPEIPDQPTRADAELALERFRRPLRGFPFAHPRYQAVAIAAILTALVRRALSIAPAFGFSAPVRASGKTMLAKIASAISTGRDPAAMPTGRDGEELRKRLFSVLLAGDPVLLIDNIDRPLESAELCAIITSETYADRVLGASRTLEVSTASTVLLTGNHLSVRGDLASRVLLSRIDPRIEFPEQRAFDFDPVEEALRDRAELAAAGLTLLRGFIAAGRPMVAARGCRFPAWARLVRDPLVWLGLDDPVETAHEAELEDEERAAVAHTLLALAERFGARTFTLADIKLAGLWPTLAEAVGSTEAEPTAYAAGRFLAHFVDRVVTWREGDPSRAFVLRARGLLHGRRRFLVEEVR